LKEPEFWKRDGNPWLARVLLPAEGIYALATAFRRWRHLPYRPPVPVVVAGGLTLGGSGKTPLALALAEHLAARQPHFVTRGYGGRTKGPLRVDGSRHTAAEVGDEPLLLARKAPTWVARNRAAGARAAIEAGAGMVILDDGFQNPFLAKDLALLAIDGEGGIGNGHVFPAGPLREPLSFALRRAAAVIRIGDDLVGVERLVGGRRPIVPARLVPTPEAAALAGQRVFAFSGIGRPEKFFASLRAIGAQLVTTRAFPDHHPYTATEAGGLLGEAAEMNAVAVTTAKDQVRLPRAAQGHVTVLEIKLVFAESRALEDLLARL
jgi:tetraacyldisaccharide 4'-kinase